MADKSVIIIGAGIAGLSAGSYLQMNDYQTGIIEMNDKPGGLCTAWERRGFTIDGCLHWLVGSAPGNDFHRMWLELGMIQGQEVIDLEQFHRYEAQDGRSFTLFTNIDRLEQHMTEVSPEDASLATELAAAMRQIARMPMPVDKASELYSAWDKVRMAAAMVPYMGPLRKWASLTMKDLSGLVKSSLIRDSLRFWPQDMSATAFMLTIAWIHTNVAGYVIGGSMPLMRAVEKRYAGLGGTITYKARVAKILVEADRAVGVRLEDGSELRADYVISAADGHTTIFDMLDGRFADDVIRGYYDSLPIFTPISYVALGVNRTFADFPQLVSGLTIGLEKPVTMGGREHTSLTVRINNFDPTLAPAGKTVLISMIDADYDYWKELRSDAPRYKREKDLMAAAVVSILEKRFPAISKQVEMVDVATPVTFERYTGNWKGCYQGFLTTPKTQRMQMRKTLPGLDRFYMVGQWVNPGGGLPSGVMTGRHLTQLLCKRDGKRFTTSVPEA